MTAIAQRSFAAGEITPALHARTDLTKYATGLRTARNFLIMREGGAANRGGTQFVAEVKDSTEEVRLIPFIFSDAQTYVMEFGAGYIRWYRDGARIVVSGVSAWADSTTYAIGDLVVNNGTNYYCIQAHTSNQSNDEPGVGTNEDDFWYDLTGDIFEIPTPYAEDDLADLQWAQSADIVTIVHPSYAPRELARTADTGWTLSTITFAPSISAPSNPSVSGGTGTGKDWDYVVTAVKDETFEESVASSTVTLSNKDNPTPTNPNIVTWDSDSDATEYNVYRAKAYPTGGTSDGVFGYLGTASSTTFNDDGLLDPDFSDSPPQARDPFSGSDNFPSTVTYYQQRIGYANTNNDPETAFFSRSANFDNFTISSPIQEDDAVTFTLVGKQVNAIRHMIDLRKLIVFTTGGEVVVNGDEAGILRPGEVNSKQQSYMGAAKVRPVVINDTIIYVQARGAGVRSYNFELESDGFKGTDLTAFSTHLFDAFSIVEIAYQQVPHSIVWCVRSDGALLSLTFLREQQIFAWTPHDTFDGSGQSTVENVTVVPEGNEDAVYIVVQRTINSASKRYIERMQTRLIPCEA